MYVPRKKYTTLFLRRVPKNLKAKFKAWCARRELSMQEVLIEFMKEKSMSDEKYLAQV